MYNRRNSSHKGWQTNTAQQKYNGTTAASTSSSPTPGQTAGSLKSRTPNAQGGESDTHDKHMHDRMLFLLTKLVSQEVTVTVKSGAQYTGILVGADPRNHDLGVSLKRVKLLKAGLGYSEEKSKEGEYLGGNYDKVMIFEQKDVVELAAQKVTFETEVTNATTHQNGVSTFKTDADISGNTQHRERELHRWQPDESTDIGLGLEESTAGPSQGWNQFEANERLFGVKSDFDENIYTTKLDRDHPEYQRRAAAAAKIAAEIEGSSSLNSHIAEERGLTIPDDSGMDEEDKYSGVQRTIPVSPNPNRYTPPARRAPTGQPTVPGAPHDPAIIASQLARPETLPKPASHPLSTSTAAPATAGPTPQPAPTATKGPEEPAAKPKERPGLPEIITPMRSLPGGAAGVAKQGDAPAIEKDLSINFKNFVTHEKERVKKKKADMAHRDRESKLRELKKFSETFTLKTAVPTDLVPILTKDKNKQAEILQKTQAAAKAAAAASTATGTQPTSAASSAQLPIRGTTPSGKVPPPDSFAAKDPERFRRDTAALLQNFPKLIPSSSLSQNVRRAQLDKNHVARPPVPVPEQHRPQFPPTGPAASNHALAANTKRLNGNARPFEFKPNPVAPSFTPTLGGQSTNATPNPTTSAQQLNVALRATSPSLFFGNKRPKTEQERPSIEENFNPFIRMKKTKAASTQTSPTPAKVYGNANDYIDKPWSSTPTWPTVDANKDKSYKTTFAPKVEFDQAIIPQPPHMMPPQPHHQQLPTHMPHISHPTHMPHQPHHGPMQPHLVPPHYEQDPHLRQMSSPSSVMPSPSLHNATVAPAYQQSPVPHPSQMAMYPPQQGAMGQYPGAPAGPQFGFYNNGFRGAAGNPMMMHGPPQPVAYAPGTMGGQFVHPQQQMYSPQQPQAYINGGPAPPPPSQGYPSPGRPAPMMMHQGSSQGTPGGAQMMPYGMQPGQGGPMYGTQGQQQMGMMRGPPPPPHQGGAPPQYYHAPQGHYPGNRGGPYNGPQGGPPPQQMVPQQQQAPPPQQPQQQTVEAGEDGK